MGRIGKIARLSALLREQLNHKLRDNRPGGEILEWINSTDEVLREIERTSEAAAITKQNLSEWRLGGYQGWLKRAEVCDYLRGVREEADDYSTASNEQPVSELLAAQLSVELMRLGQALLAEVTDPKERWNQLKEMLPLLAQLRRADYWTANLEMKKEEWHWKYEEHYRQKALQDYINGRLGRNGTDEDREEVPDISKAGQS